MASVLLLEDHPNQRLLYQIELEDWGHRVQTPHNLPQALQAIRETPPDVVVLDPYLSDYRKTDSLREIKDFAPQIPVIIYTGDTLFEDDCRYFLADAFLTKSSDISVLIRTINRLLPQQPRNARLEMCAF